MTFGMPINSWLSNTEYLPFTFPTLDGVTCKVPWKQESEVESEVENALMLANVWSKYEPSIMDIRM